MREAGTAQPPGFGAVVQVREHHSSASASLTAESFGGGALAAGLVPAASARAP